MVCEGVLRVIDVVAAAVVCTCVGTLVCLFVYVCVMCMYVHMCECLRAWEFIAV